MSRPYLDDGCIACGSQEWNDALTDVEHAKDCPVAVLEEACIEVSRCILGYEAERNSGLSLAPGWYVKARSWLDDHGGLRR
jgi:hypothetical protein